MLLGTVRSIPWTVIVAITTDQPDYQTDNTPSTSVQRKLINSSYIALVS